jgi:hypothetical protein
MADVNPYEPPKSESPLSGAKAVKRWFGVGLILLLTPPALVVASVTSCADSRWVPGSSPLQLTIAGPLAVLTALMFWAAAIHYARQGAPRHTPSRIALLLSTPLFVAGGTAVGFLLTWLVVDLASRVEHGLSINGIRWGLANLLLVPGATLIAMLWTAWRAD